jgi:hypothetical protein
MIGSTNSHSKSWENLEEVSHAQSVKHLIQSVVVLLLSFLFSERVCFRLQPKQFSERFFNNVRFP